MKFFEWLNGPPETEVQRAIKTLDKYKVCNRFSVTNTYDHLMIGNIKRSWLWKRGYFDYYDVKFSKSGNEAMISKKGSVDFFFASKEEVDELKLHLGKKFGLNYGN